MPTETELAWLAGMVDGEGCISIAGVKSHKQGGNPGHRLVLVVTNSDKRAVDRCTAIGGSGSIHRSSNRGKGTWQWHCNSGQAAGVLRSILPHLVIKREQAEIAIEFSELPTTRNCHDGVSDETFSRRDALAQQLKAMH